MGDEEEREEVAVMNGPILWTTRATQAGETVGGLLDHETVWILTGVRDSADGS